MAEPTSTSLDTLIEAFQREVSLPGLFATDYPTISEEDVLALLGDAFGAAQLDGWFADGDIDVDAGNVTPALSTAGAALVVLYAGMRLIRTQLRNATTMTRYKAGPVEYETQTSANLLTQLLKDLEGRRKALTDQARVGARVTYVSDGYYDRLTSYPGTFAIWEIPMLPALAFGR